MDGTDLRDLAGRGRRLLLASLLGVVCSGFVAWILPMRNHAPVHWRSCLGDGGPGIDGAILIAGAVGFTLALYAMLQAIAARQRRVVLPRAVVRTWGSRGYGAVAVVKARCRRVDAIDRQLTAR